MGAVSRKQWEDAGGDKEQLKKVMTAHKPVLTCKQVTLLLSEGFKSNHAGLLRFFEHVVQLPGSKWKIIQAGANQPRTLFKVDTLNDVSSLLKHVRTTANCSLRSAFKK